MNEPLRFRHPHSSASPLLRRLLEDAAPSRAMTEDEAERLGRSLLRSLATKSASGSARTRRWALAIAFALAFGGTSFAFEWLAGEAPRDEGPIAVRETRPMPEVERNDDEPATPVRRPDDEASRATPAPRTHALPRSARAVHAPKVADDPTPEISEPDPLRREIAILRAAQSALGGAPTQALVHAERHAREFPSGQLVVERELLAIEALVRSGRSTEAHARAARFEAVSGREAYKSRLASILAWRSDEPRKTP